MCTTTESMSAEALTKFTSATGMTITFNSEETFTSDSAGSEDVRRESTVTGRFFPPKHWCISEMSSEDMEKFLAEFSELWRQATVASSGYGMRLIFPKSDTKDGSTGPSQGEAECFDL